MFGLFKRASKNKFDRKILRKNNIVLLPLDERWNSLFSDSQKTPEIYACEKKIRELLKEQVRLVSEAKEIANKKKVYMDKIINLTPEVFDKNNEGAKHEMQNSDKEIKAINERLKKIETELEEIPDRIKEINLELLEHTVNVVYFKIRSGQKRVVELDALIEETRTRLKDYIDEKEILSQGGDDIYTYFHDLLGAEELEKLDREYFG